LTGNPKTDMTSQQGIDLTQWAKLRIAVCWSIKLQKLERSLKFKRVIAQFR
jgi:hypothetical protein